MDDHLQHNISTLNYYMNQQDVQGLWRTISRCIERAIADATENDSRKKKQMMGHGKPNMKVTKVPHQMQERNNINANDDADDSLMKHASGEGKEAQRCLRQNRRFLQIINGLQRKAANFPTKEDTKHTRQRTTKSKQELTIIHNNMNRLCVYTLRHHLNKDNEHELALDEFLA